MIPSWLPLLLACAPQEAPPVPEAPEPPRSAAPSGDTDQPLPPPPDPEKLPGPDEGTPIYTYVLEGPDGLLEERRVFDDGRVWFRGADDTWILQGVLFERTLDRLREALARQDVATLPAQLVEPPNASDLAPRATWQWTTEDGTRRVVVPKLEAVRIPQLERVADIVRSGLTNRPDGLETWWRVGDGAAARVVHVPCDPRPRQPLGALTEVLDEPDLPAALAERPGDLLLEVRWIDHHERRTTRLLADGRLYRNRPYGPLEAFQVDRERMDTVRELLRTIDWDAAPAVCER